MNSEMLEYAVDSFAFILPRNGVFTFQEWAAAIKKAYDAANLRTNAVVAEIEKSPYKIERNNGRSKVLTNG